MARMEQSGWPEAMHQQAEFQDRPTINEGPVVLRRATGKNPGGGVCAGVARYLQIDVTFVRLIIVLRTMASGVGLPLYIAGYMAIPRAKDGERTSFDLGSGQLRNARMVALILTIALAIFAAVVTLIQVIGSLSG